jgi:hypothetical protein
VRTWQNKENPEKNKKKSGFQEKVKKKEPGGPLTGMISPSNRLLFLKIQDCGFFIPQIPFSRCGAPCQPKIKV